MILSGDFLCKADRYASIEKGDLYPVFIFERGNIPEHRHEILFGAGRGRQHQRRCPAAVRHPAGLLRTDEAAGNRLRRGAGPLHLPSAAPEQCDQQSPSVMFPSANLIALFLWNRFYLVKANFAHRSSSFSCAKIAGRPSLSEPGCRISG